MTPLLVWLAVVALLGAALTPSPAAAETEPQHRAGVVVDTGGQVRSVCVGFSESELTGLELLRRAGFAPEVGEFPGLGTAVCALDGVGCSADDCFCEAGSGSYWNYHLGTDGGWQPAPHGAGARAVTDGTVDGWAWGVRGSAPPVRALADICAGGPLARGEAAGSATPPAGGGPGAGGVLGPVLAAGIAAVLATLAVVIWRRRRSW